MKTSTLMLSALLTLGVQPFGRDSLLYAATGEETAGGGLEEIVVTATKREESLQKASAAITAITADKIIAAGITDLRAAQMYVPNVRFQPEQNNNQVFIRGVGANLDFANNEPSVGFIFAGSYVPREGTTAAFFDISQIEALPGPQGTLYGRSAIGGTIVVSPTLPAHDTTGSALLEVGNYSAVHGTITQNINVSNSLALRAAVDYTSHTGYQTSGADAQRDIAGRISALFEPSEDTSILWWAQYAKKGGHTANLVNKGFDPATQSYSEDSYLHSNPWDDTRTGPLAPLALFGNAVADNQHYNTFMTGGRFEWRIGGITVTDIPSYFYLDSRPDYWLGTIRIRNTAHYNQVANELRFSNTNSGKINWLAGLYVYRVSNSSVATLFTNQPFAFRQSNIPDNRLKNAAIFGQASISLTDQFRVIAGGRFGRDKRNASGLAPDTLGAAPWSFNRTFNHFDWKIGAEFDASPASMLYATIQTGNKPGAYNEIPATPSQDNLVRPSNLRAYTVGYKSRWLDDRLQFNAEAFYYDYRELATQAYDVSAPFNPVFNAQKVTIPGAQLDLNYEVVTNGQLNLNVGYIHARNKDFITPAGQDFSGLSPPYAADWTVLMGYSQGIHVGEGMLRGRIDARYESAWYADYVHNLGVRQSANTKADISLTYEASKLWSVGVWCKNLSNKAVIAATAAAGIPGPATAYLEAPRTYGLRVMFTY